MVIGERSLGSKIKNISRTRSWALKVLHQPLNQATAVTTLDNSGFEARHIMAGSGYRNEASIRSYSRTDISTKKKMSETLTEARGAECELRINNEAPLSPILRLSPKNVHIQNSQVTN